MKGLEFLKLHETNSYLSAYMRFAISLAHLGSYLAQRNCKAAVWVARCAIVEQVNKVSKGLMHQWQWHFMAFYWSVVHDIGITAKTRKALGLICHSRGRGQEVALAQLLPKRCFCRHMHSKLKGQMPSRRSTQQD